MTGDEEATQEIARLAEIRWQEAGKPKGEDERFWLQAEKELKPLHEFRAEIRRKKENGEPLPEPKEFFSKELFPMTMVPETPMWRKIYCKLTGGHSWRKFLWGGVLSMFDCDSCSKCYKFRGPLPEDRNTPIFPCQINPW